VLVAVFLAIAVHMALISFNFDPKPMLVPSVSLPRSVSVFLNQRNMVETPEAQRENIQTAKQRVDEQAAAVPQKNSATKEITKTRLQQPSLSEKTVKQPSVEKFVPVPQHPVNTKKDVMSAPGRTARGQKSSTQAKSQTVQEEEGGILPGTLQLAYPRYQLNNPPAYPGQARKRGQAGTVVLQVLVNRKGSVDDLKIETSSGFKLLDRAAVTAVQKWLFEPGQRGEEKIEMWVKVPVTFQLK
jgi:TonB family protein